MVTIDKAILQTCKLTLDDDISKHAQWIIKNIYHQEFKDEYEQYLSRQYGIARLGHGGQHVSRTAIYGKILASFVFKTRCVQYRSIEELEYAIKQIKILQIVLLLHDSGREGDDEDLWDKDSAINCYKYLTKVLKLSKEEAIKWAERIVNKSFKKISKYKKLQVTKDKNGKEQFNWLEVDKSTQQQDDIFRDIIHDADVLDIMRTPKGENFDIKRLYIFDRCKRKNKKLEKLLQKIVESARQLIEKQDAINGKMTIDVINKKKTYENSKSCCKLFRFRKSTIKLLKQEKSNAFVSVKNEIIKI
jgi:hypothetical protein